MKSYMETFHYGGLQNKYVYNPMTIVTIKKCILLNEWTTQRKFQVQVLSKEIKSKPVGVPQ